jgi:hypothetical protein
MRTPVSTACPGHKAPPIFTRKRKIALVLYLSYQERNMIDIFLGIGVAVFVVYMGYHISYILSMKHTSERMGDFIQKTEGSLNAAFVEFKDTLENMKKITGNVSAVSHDVRQIKSTIANVEKIRRVLFK